MERMNTNGVWWVRAGTTGMIVGALLFISTSTPILARAPALYFQYLPLVSLIRPIAFESDRDGNEHHGLFLMQSDGTSVTQVAGPAWVSCPTWSNNGANLAYASQLENDIYTVRSDGVGLTQITQGTRLESDPVWSPEDEFVVFAGTDWTIGGIYAVKPDQPSEIPMITGYKQTFWTPRFSNDGTLLAFASNMDGNSEVYIADIEHHPGSIQFASSPRRLTFSEYWDAYPSISPDNQWVVFYSARDGDNEIWKVRADGTELTQLTSNTSDDANPVWSPDGSGIMFTSQRDGNFEIYVMSADGSNQVNLTRSPFWEGCASWLH